MLAPVGALQETAARAHSVSDPTACEHQACVYSRCDSTPLAYRVHEGAPGNGSPTAGNDMMGSLTLSVFSASRNARRTYSVSSDGDISPASNAQRI